MKFEGELQLLMYEDGWRIRLKRKWYLRDLYWWSGIEEWKTGKPFKYSSRAEYRERSFDKAKDALNTLRNPKAMKSRKESDRYPTILRSEPYPEGKSDDDKA